MAYITMIAIWKTNTRRSSQVETDKPLQMANYVHKLREDKSLENVQTFSKDLSTQVDLLGLTR